MTVLLVVAPFCAFALLMLLTSATASLFAACGVCLAVIAFDAWRGRSLKILGAGSAVVFAALGTYLAFVDPSLSGSAVRFMVDAGTFAIALGSILLRYPFTLQYGLEMVPAETAAKPEFTHANYVITGAWTIAMLVMMLANGAIWIVPGLPLWLGLLVAFAARNGALYFTRWYRDYRTPKHGSPPADALRNAR
ncbi:MAG: hypothetical protein JOY90_15990 [Bradyrhizobium sp.]|uniref:hypothetical protein n=1 Tax=Bradyrhizobium sp. TaxID=376 RepID=UPI001DFC0E3A|nr:hypothetical protein [Bradyrhizobium sp.]MBV9561930.1 hypothetical protein [Bradyrhizobium sp.]